MKRMKFDLVLLEREGESGLTKDDVLMLLEKLNSDEFFPIEIYAKQHESSAMGFITTKFADTLDFDYDASGLNTFIANILDDMQNETKNGVYDTFKNSKIYLTR